MFIYSTINYSMLSMQNKVYNCTVLYEFATLCARCDNLVSSDAFSFKGRYLKRGYLSSDGYVH